MKEYTIAAGGVLLIALLVAWRRGLWTDWAVWLGMLAFAALTVVADVVLTAAGVFAYNPQFLSGVRIDRMPLEDLAYGIALYLVAVLAWSWEPGDAG